MNTYNRLRRPMSLLAVGSLTATGVVIAGPAQAAELDLSARMNATTAHPHSSGHAEYDRGVAGREFEISIAGVRSLAGRQLTVRAHGDFVGKVTVGPNGRAHLRRRFGVTKMGTGTEIRVRTASGNLVAQGIMHRDRED